MWLPDWSNIRNLGSTPQPSDVGNEGFSLRFPTKNVNDPGGDCYCGVEPNNIPFLQVSFSGKWRDNYKVITNHWRYTHVSLNHDIMISWEEEYSQSSLELWNRCGLKQPKNCWGISYVPKLIWGGVHTHRWGWGWAIFLEFAEVFPSLKNYYFIVTRYVG